MMMDSNFEVVLMGLAIWQIWGFHLITLHLEENRIIDELHPSCCFYFMKK